MYQIDNIIIMFIPIVSIIAGCALLAVAIWASQRRREREIHYRHELLKRFVEKGAEREEVAALMREQTRNQWASRREGLKIAGIVTLFSGIGTMYGMTFIEDDPLWRLGSIPALIGAALLLYALVMAPSEPGPR